jgi:apolipoprotein N-acyltransferase
MFLLSLIPDSFLQMAIFAIIATGIVIYMASFFLALVPVLIPYRPIFHVLSLLFILVGVYFTGGYGTEMEWRKRVHDMEAKVAKAEEQSKQANSQLDNKAQQKVKIIREKGLVVKQYIDREVTKYDNQCVIPKEFVKAHNDSAEKAK